MLERPERRGQAGEADDRVQDDIRLGAVEQLGEVAPDLGERRETRRRAASPTLRHELEPGVASTISIAWRPIEPVAPSRATRFI